MSKLIEMDNCYLGHFWDSETKTLKRWHKPQEEECLFVRNSFFLRNAEKRFFKGEKWEYKYEE